MKIKPLFLSVVMTSLLSIVIGCGSGGSGGDSGSSTGTVNTTISDPPTCKGSIEQVWVTITRVRAHTSNNAAPNDSGWIDLVDLRNAPKQVDLLSLDSPNCILTQLGSTGGLPAGQYQQIRLYLLSNSAGSGQVTPNNCKESGGYNCVVSENTVKPLLLSSEAQTGLKIPSGQIAGGKFRVEGGQSTDLNIDFDACSSIVQQGNGQYRLKPVLHAGEISLNNSSISGRVVEIIDKTNNPIPNAVVLVEQRDPSDANLDRIRMQKTTGSDGRFIFCPLSSGPYDIVAAAANSTKTYNATVTLAVPVGTNMGDIPLVPEADGTPPSQIQGRITSNPNPVDISLSALQQAVEGANPLFVIIPLFEGSTPNVTTESGGNCSAGTLCADYTLYVPGSNPQVGTFPITSLTPYTGPAAAPVNYWVNAQASPECTSPSAPIPIEVTPGGDTTQNINATGCGP